MPSHYRYKETKTALDQQIAKLSEHLLALDYKTAESLGFYQQADDLVAERAAVESELSSKSAGPSMPKLGDLRRRIGAEFDLLGEVMSSGTLEERRELISCYIHKIKADPDQQVVHIGLYPTLLS